MADDSLPDMDLCRIETLTLNEHEWRDESDEDVEAPAEDEQARTAIIKIPPIQCLPNEEAYLKTLDNFKSNNAKISKEEWFWNKVDELKNSNCSNEGNYQLQFQDGVVLIDEKELIIPPPSQYYKILTRIHLQLAHAGIHKTFQRVKQENYKISRLAVKNYLDLCPPCKNRKNAKFNPNVKVNRPAVIPGNTNDSASSEDASCSTQRPKRNRQRPNYLEA